MSDWQYRYGQWVRSESLQTWGKQNWLDLYQSCNFMVLLGLTGFVCVVIGLLIINILGA